MRKLDDCDYGYSSHYKIEYTAGKTFTGGKIVIYGHDYDKAAALIIDQNNSITKFYDQFDDEDCSGYTLREITEFNSFQIIDDTYYFSMDSRVDFEDNCHSTLSAHEGNEYQIVAAYNSVTQSFLFVKTVGINNNSYLLNNRIHFRKFSDGYRAFIAAPSNRGIVAKLTLLLAVTNEVNPKYSSYMYLQYCYKMFEITGQILVGWYKTTSSPELILYQDSSLDILYGITIYNLEAFEVLEEKYSCYITKTAPGIIIYFEDGTDQSQKSTHAFMNAKDPFIATSNNKFYISFQQNSIYGACIAITTTNMLTGSKSGDFEKILCHTYLSYEDDYQLLGVFSDHYKWVAYRSNYWKAFRFDLTSFQNYAGVAQTYPGEFYYTGDDLTEPTSVTLINESLYSASLSNAFNYSLLSFQLSDSGSTETCKPEPYLVQKADVPQQYLDAVGGSIDNDGSPVTYACTYAYVRPADYKYYSGCSISSKSLISNYYSTQMLYAGNRYIYVQVTTSGDKFYGLMIPVEIPNEPPEYVKQLDMNGTGHVVISVQSSWYFYYDHGSTDREEQHFYDPEGDSIFFYLEDMSGNKLDWLTFNSYGYWQKNHYNCPNTGIHDVKFFFSDDEYGEYHAYQSFTTKIEFAKSPPYLKKAIPDVTYLQGQQNTYTIYQSTYIGDLDYDTVVCSEVSAPSFTSQSFVTNYIYVYINQPLNSDIGDHTFQISCTDNESSPDLVTSFTITIEENTPPVVKTVSDTIVYIGWSINKYYYHSNSFSNIQTQETHTYSVSYSPVLTGVSITEQTSYFRVYRSSVTKEERGTYVFTVQVEDEGGNQVDNNINIIIKGSDPTSYSANPEDFDDILSGPKQELTRDMTDECDDNDDDDLTYNFVSISPEPTFTYAFSTENSGKSIKFDADTSHNHSQTYTVTVECDDEIDGTSDFTYDINYIYNNPGTITPGSDFTSDFQGSTIWYATDPTTSPSRTFNMGSYFDDPDIASYNEPQTVTITSSHNWITGSFTSPTLTLVGNDLDITHRGKHTVTFDISDTFPQSVTYTIDIEVRSQRPNVLDSINNIEVYAGQTYQIVIDDIGDYFEDPEGEELTITLDNARGFITLDDSLKPKYTINFTPQPGDEDQDDLELIATDPDGGSNSIDFEWEVLENNTPYEDSGISDMTITEMGFIQSLNSDAFTDDENDVLIYTITLCDLSPLSWATVTASEVTFAQLPESLTSPQCIQICCSDQITGNAKACIDVNVDINFQPNLISGAPFLMQVASNIEYEIDLPAWITDDILASNGLSYSVLKTNGNQFPFGTINGDLKLILLPEDSHLGTHEVIVYVDDGQNPPLEWQIDFETTINCFLHCTECFDSSSVGCSDCETGFKIQDTSCVAICNTGYYTLDAETCDSCHDNCDECTGPGNLNGECQICSNIAYNYYDEDGNLNCVDTCPDGTYPNLQRTCSVCHESCNTCYGGMNFECTSCPSNMPGNLVNGFCLILQCTIGEYQIFNSITGKYECKNCDETCYECFGPSQYDCFSCDDTTRFLDGTQCITCNDVEGKKTPETGGIDCIEICGDGIDQETLQCDDGNVENGDGCSAICEVEDGFKCENGTLLQPDECIDIRLPICTFSSMNKGFVANVKCDEPMKLGDFTETTFGVKVSGPRVPYSFVWVFNDEFISGAEEFTDFSITLTFESQVLGEDQETIELYFYEPDLFTDIAGNPIANLMTSIKVAEKIDAMSETEEEEVGNSGGFSLFAILLGLGLNIILGGTVQASWILMNTLQMVSIIPLMSMFFPSMIMEFTRILTPLNGEPSFVPNVFEQYVYSSGQINVNPYSFNYNALGFSTKYFMMNASRKILLTFVCTLGIPFAVIMYKTTRKSTGCIRKYADKIDSKLRWQVFTRAVAQSYLSFSLSALLNVYTLEWTTIHEIYINIIGVIGTLIIIYIPIHFFSIIQHNHNRLENPEFVRRYQNILNDIDTTHPLRYHFYTVFFFRRVVYTGIILIFEGWPGVQLSLAFLQSFLMLVYILKFRPYSGWISRVLTILNEVGLIIAFGLTVPFYNATALSSIEATNFGRTFIYFIITLIGVNWVLIIYDKFSQFKRARKLKKLMQKEECKEKSLMLKNNFVQKEAFPPPQQSMNLSSKKTAPSTISSSLKRHIKISKELQKLNSKSPTPLASANQAPAAFTPISPVSVLEPNVLAPPQVQKSPSRRSRRSGKPAKTTTLAPPQITPAVGGGSGRQMNQQRPKSQVAPAHNRITNMTPDKKENSTEKQFLNQLKFQLKLMDKVNNKIQ